MQTIHPTLKAITPLTEDVFEYTFDWNREPVDFKAGQFFMLKVQDGKEPKVNRSYSTASAPNDQGFKLCIKLIEGGRGSEYFRSSKVGDQMEFMAPLGHFYLKDSPKDIIMVATGTGLAPFMGMLPVLFEQGFEGKLRLYFGVRDESDLFYVDQLEAWMAAHENFEAIMTLSRPEENWAGASGRVTDHLKDCELDPENTQVYICGNGQMVKDVRALMMERGLEKTDIHLEQFTPA